VNKYVDVILQTGFVDSARDMVISFLETFDQLADFERGTQSLFRIRIVYKVLLRIAAASAFGTAQRELVQTNFADLDALSSRVKVVLSQASSRFTEGQKSLVTKLHDVMNELSSTISNIAENDLSRG
jgi:hypothetical protein